MVQNSDPFGPKLDSAGSKLSCGLTFIRYIGHVGKLRFFQDWLSGVTDIVKFRFAEHWNSRRKWKKWWGFLNEPTACMNGSMALAVRRRRSFASWQASLFRLLLGSRMFCRIVSRSSCDTTSDSVMSGHIKSNMKLFTLCVCLALKCYKHKKTKIQNSDITDTDIGFFPHILWFGWSNFNEISFI